MPKYIAEGTRVVINTLEGEYTGTVISYRDGLLEELNQAEPLNPDKPMPNLPQFPLPIDLKRIITFYTVKLDDPTGFQGILDGDLATVYKFIRPLE